MVAVLLYDGDCGFCTACAHAVQRWVPSDAHVVPYQRAPLSSLGVPEAAAAESVQWVDESARYAGPDALAALLRSSSQAAWRLTGRALGLPPVRAVAWPAYRLISRYRGRLPGVTPACARPALPTGAPAGPVPASGVDAGRLRPRRRRDTDIGGCVRLLYNAAGSDPAATAQLPDDPPAWLSPDGLLGAWVVKHDAHYVGHVAASTMDGNRAEALRWRELIGADAGELGLVSRLLLRPAGRADGVARGLLEEAVGAVRDRGLVPVSVVPAYDHAAQDAYAAAGWRLAGIYPATGADDQASLYYYRHVGTSG